jgi:hypothetical protein
VSRKDGCREKISVEEDECRGEMGVEERKEKCHRECYSRKELVDYRGEWEIERIYIRVQ